MTRNRSTNLRKPEAISSNNTSSTAVDLLSLVLTSAVVPLISHALTIAFGDDSFWSTDRLFVIYFSAISGIVIVDKLVRMLRANGMWQRGYKLGDSDAFMNLASVTPVVIVLGCYNTLPGVIAIASIYATAVIILWFDKYGFTLHPKQLYITGLIAVAVGTLCYLFQGLFIKDNLLVMCFIFTVSQLIVCALFDLVRIVYKRLQ